MRSEDKRGAGAERRQNALERLKNFDVGIEIEHEIVAELIKEVLEHEWLDRGVQLHDVVAEREASEIRNSQLRGFNDGPVRII